MKEFKKILFAVDLSESSEKIAPYVQALAEKFHSKIYLLLDLNNLSRPRPRIHYYI